MKTKIEAIISTQINVNQLICPKPSKIHIKNHILYKMNINFNTKNNKKL